MRRLAHLSRPLNALFALWFAIVLGDPGVLHSCAMHGAARGAHQTAAATAPVDHSGQPGHAGHVGHGSPDAASAGQVAPVEAQHHDTPAPCGCVGQCCAAPVASPVPAVDAVHVPEAVAEVRHPLAVPRTDAFASPDLRLPFANGPPGA